MTAQEIDAREGQAVSVTWLDSSMRPGWIYGDDLDATPKSIQSVGFICARSDTAITITHGISATGGFVSPMTIPICCIIGCRIIDL